MEKKQYEQYKKLKMRDPATLTFKERNILNMITKKMAQNAKKRDAEKAAQPVSVRSITRFGK
jgi:hypothetical protein